MRALFLTWDGPQQTYLESLFFPIFAGLRAHGVEMSVLQLTWAGAEQLEPVRAAAGRHGLVYRSAHVPPLLRKAALPLVLAYGARLALGELERNGATSLMPRSLLPMAMAQLARAARPGLDLLFDADGFMADERVDFGAWSERGFSYRALRRVEARGVRQARAVVCRTAAAREILCQRAGDADATTRAKIFVAPNGKDSGLFAPAPSDAQRATRARYAVPSDAPWLVYLGSVGPQYCLELMLETFREVRARRADARFSCFTFQADHVRQVARRLGIVPEALVLQQLPPREVPAVLAACDLGLAFRRESLSQRGVSPIKVAEYLLSGATVAASRVGDLSEQLGGSSAALLVDPEAAESARRVADWFVSQVLPQREECRLEAREQGLRWFSLSRNVETFAAALAHGREGPR